MFTDRDAAGQPGVAIVGESLAARVWPGQNAIGKRLIASMTGTEYQKSGLTVVGVVADARYRELHATRLDFYVSHLQADTPLGYLVVRAAGEPTALTPAIRAVVRELDSNVAVTEVASMDQIVSQVLGNPRFTARVFGVLWIRCARAGRAWRVWPAFVFGDMPHAGDRRENGARRERRGRARQRARRR